MIERQLHEPREGDAAAGDRVDFGADDRDQIRVAGVGKMIRIDSVRLRGASHSVDCRGKGERERGMKMPPV
jgi:hypothetical protein